MAGDEYSIADMALRWTNQIAKRPAMKRGRMVNRAWGEASSQLHERNAASEFETKTADKNSG
jgi:GST-like protein